MALALRILHLETSGFVETSIVRHRAQFGPGSSNAASISTPPNSPSQLVKRLQPISLVEKGVKGRKKST